MGVLIVLLLGLGTPLFGLKPAFLELELLFGPGFPLGTMQDRIDATLIPKPDGLQEFKVGARGAWYFLPYLGVEGFAQAGEIAAASEKTSTPLSVIDDSSWGVGPVGRAILPLSDVSYLSFMASGGVTVHTMSWNNDYTSLFPGEIFADLAPKPGFYGKAGMEIRGWNVTFGVSVMYERIPVTLSNGTDLSTDCWTVPLELGLAF